MRALASVDPDQMTRDALLDEPGEFGAGTGISDDGQTDDPLELIVRAVSPRDVLPLVRPPALVPLALPDHSPDGRHPLRVALASIVPARGSRPRAFVAAAGGRIVGFLHFQPEAPDRRWMAVSIGASAGVYDADPVWEALLRQATIAAGVRDVKRLYAKVPCGSPMLSSFRRVGFAPYATETVFVAEGVGGLGPPAPLRPQQHTDTWAIHQLYNAAVPKQVQYAEAYTSHRWDLRRRGGLDRASARRAWLLDDGHHVMAYARVSSTGRRHVMDVLCHPESAHALPGVVDAVLALLARESPGSQISIALRSYQAEAQTVLQRRGFEPLLEQDVLVKYTTALARQPVAESLAFHTDVIERLPKRVPSFLSSPRRDESTP